MIKSNFEDLRRAKAFREKRNLSLRQVAEETQLSLGTILRIKAEYPDRIDCTTLDVLCRYFDCKVGEILERPTKQNQIAGIEKIISYEGRLTLATEAEIRRYFAKDAVMSLKLQNQKWENIEEIIQYYAAFHGSKLEYVQYEHNILDLKIIEDVAIVASRSQYRGAFGDDWNAYYWQVWKLQESAANSTGWCIKSLLGGLIEEEVKAQFDALCELSQKPISK